jgi:hypothetical protein
MGGRESRRGPGGDQGVSLIGLDVTALEEPCTKSNEESDRVEKGRSGGHCTVGFLSSRSVAEEPILASENR